MCEESSFSTRKIFSMSGRNCVSSKSPVKKSNKKSRFRYGKKSGIPFEEKFQKKKFRWHDGEGRQLTAGGLLPFDDNGIWVIGEKKGKNSDIEWTDPGGKYKFEDCDIYTTISREFSEELYHSSFISRENILRIKDSHSPVYVNGHHKHPVYICYTVHISELKKYNVELNPELFLENRKKALQGNPDVPEEFYNSVELKYLPFDEIMNSTNISYRLRRILRYSILSSYIPSFLNSKNYPENRSSSPDISSESSSDREENFLPTITTLDELMNYIELLCKNEKELKTSR